jgi:hypothetical protein
MYAFKTQWTDFNLKDPVVFREDGQTQWIIRNGRKKGDVVMVELKMDDDSVMRNVETLPEDVKTKITGRIHN